MNGMGILRGLGVTFKRFFDTFLDDLSWLGKRYYTKEGLNRRMSTDTRGIFTIQYPEEKQPVPEEFRFIPFLVYDEDSNGERHVRCTSCGICAEVCPPQCIWIVRAENSNTGRSIPEPQEFFIDVDICMNCGLCAEYCPFDSIMMDHDYELSVYDRHTKNIYNKERLLKPVSYYAKIRPTSYSRELVARAEAEEVKSVMLQQRQ
jgi:NADH-quinone oxidoreductase subunit I